MTATQRMTEPYVRMVARDAYFWAWPMINVYNRRLAFKDVPVPGLMGGVAPAAPVNHLSMLSNYIEPQERVVACPNQDVVYGGCALGLDESPVIIQVPDFGKRFWVYQIVDLRTDSFAELGAMYGTPPGFYLLVGPDWKGDAPQGIAKVFRATTQTGFVVPRVFQEDTPQDNTAVRSIISGIDLYPLAMYDGQMKRRDWSKIPNFPTDTSSESETKWVVPERFVDELPLVMKDAPPLPGEEARYARIRAVLAAAQSDPALKQVMTDEAAKAEQELVAPLFEFRNYGIVLPHHWSKQDNGAMFGTDYLTRTAVAKSNILVNKPSETTYFYQDLDASGDRLDGANRYTVTFPMDGLPPVRGFWSLTLYNENHFFAPNDLKRYSLGTKNKGLQANADGSLTLYVQADSPGAGKEANWLPAPKGPFSLYVRAYWPTEAITSGNWTPPAVTRA
ncbi:DUF1254 domain-containing protein [Variovorax robiniae]|uniref:DUF1254 domain-containing protein n=1 Tax=Variovorax robiniae TaxID=1836199 RepID=A0ABU8XD53_9BURK